MFCLFLGPQLVSGLVILVILLAFDFCLRSVCGFLQWEGLLELPSLPLLETEAIVKEFFSKL